MIKIIIEDRRPNSHLDRGKARFTDFLPIIPLAQGIPLCWPYNPQFVKAIAAGGHSPFQAYHWPSALFGAISTSGANDFKTTAGKIRQTVRIEYVRTEDHGSELGWRVDLETPTGFFHALTHFIELSRTTFERGNEEDGDFREAVLDAIWRKATDFNTGGPFNLYKELFKGENMARRGLTYLKNRAFRANKTNVAQEALLLARLIQGLHNYVKELEGFDAKEAKKEWEAATEEEREQEWGV